MPVLSARMAAVKYGSKEKVLLSDLPDSREIRTPQAQPIDQGAEDES